MSEEKKIQGALQPGTVVCSSKQRYRIDKVLGAGGFGITYRVTRLSDGFVFALKEYFRKELCERDDNHYISYLKSNKETIEGGVEDFITEARRLDRQNITHPNIVSVDEVFKANNTAYYTMEYVAGDDLLRYIQKQDNTPLTEEQTLSVMRPIFQAVAKLHEHHITHLDIKHENILLTREDDGSLRPVLIDFGLSKHYDKKGKATSTFTAAGCTDGFAPQEQYLGLTTFTPQADVYALAATMLYLLTGKWPVKSSDISAKKIIEALPEGVSERTQDAIVHAMRKDKEDRTPSVEKFADELGLDLTEKSAEGSVTRLLTIKKNKVKKPFDFSKYLKPTVWALGACAVIAGVILLFNSFPTGERVPEEILPADTLAVVEPVDTITPSIPEMARQADYNSEKDQITAERPEKEDSRKTETDKSEINSAKEDKEPPEDNLARQFANAKTLQDFQVLADKNYAPAYAPLAERYLQARQYKSADRYLRMAVAAGNGTAQAKRVAETLKAIGYYDDSSNGTYPF